MNLIFKSYFSSKFHNIFMISFTTFFIETNTYKKVVTRGSLPKHTHGCNCILYPRACTSEIKLISFSY